jgi:hypothetical protein
MAENSFLEQSGLGSIPKINTWHGTCNVQGAIPVPMIETIHHLSRRAGTSFTKACVRHGCAMRPVASSQQNQQWNKKTGAGFTA